MQKKLLNPKNDYVFKRIFGYKENASITKAFLEDVIDEEIKSIEIIQDAVLEKEILSDKIGILDIKAILNNNTYADIEMQILKDKNIIQRLLFYWSKMYISNIKKGDTYQKLKKTIVILIADFKFDELKEINECCSKWNIKEDKKGKIILTNIFEIYIIELPKSKKCPEEKLTKWAKFFQNPDEMGELEMNDKEIKKAKKCLEDISNNEKEMRLAELREKYIRDMKSMEETGIEQGIEQGKKESIEKIVKKMIALKISIGEIQKITGLSEDEIRIIENKN